MNQPSANLMGAIELVKRPIEGGGEVITDGKPVAE
jgi:hypothetical protein